MHRTTDRFWDSFERLPEGLQKLARENFELLKTNPLHPSLHFKKVGQFWSARIALNYRALAVEDGSDFVWVWIGPHDEYRQLIRKQR